MKRLVLVFVFSALLGLLAIPAHNLSTRASQTAPVWKQAELFNMNAVSKLPAALLVRAGISIDPEQVIVGREAWMFLGDRFEQTVSSARRGMSPETEAAVQRLGDASEAWNQWLSRHGVKHYRLMVGPNKDTIYPEFTPSWARPRQPSALDTLTRNENSDRFVNVQSSLVAAKASSPVPLYYRTDTHWNARGAGLAFKALAENLARSAPALRWPEAGAYEVLDVRPRPGGDLARFLRLEQHMTDVEVGLRLALVQDSVSFRHFDGSAAVAPEQLPMLVSQPVLMSSSRALNRTRVLWLRDSFGDAMLPFMASTFSDVVMMHWNEALKPGGRFAELVETWKPEYVLVTVVERGMQSPLLALGPPKVVALGPESFVAQTAGMMQGANSISATESAGEFVVAGTDPFIDFALQSPALPDVASHLSLTIRCEDGSTNIPAQVFWLKEGKPTYDEANSVQLSLKPGQSVVDLQVAPGWRGAAKILRLRFDIDAGERCKRFTLGPLELGRTTP